MFQIFAVVQDVTPNGIVINADMAAVVTALSLLVTSISGLLVAIRARAEAGVAREENKIEVAKVKQLVNGHTTAQAREIGSLTRALHDAGIEIPQIEIAPIFGRRETDIPGAVPISGTIDGKITPPADLPGTKDGTETEIHGRIDGVIGPPSP